MPRDSVVAQRYARALFQISQDKNGQSLGLTLNEMEALEGAFKQTPEVLEFFVSPVVPRNEKLEALEPLKTRLSHIHRFLVVLVESNRMGLFSDILCEFRLLGEDAGAELGVEILTATEPNQRLAEEIKNFVQETWARPVKIKSTIDKSIIGGFIARAPGRVIDASVRTQLENLEQQITA